MAVLDLLWAACLPPTKRAKSNRPVRF